MTSQSEQQNSETARIIGAEPAKASVSVYKGFSATMASPGAKFVLLGIIIFALMIPTLMVWGIVEERAGRSRTVANEISQGWGTPQVINGPYLVVPYEKQVNLNVSNYEGTKVEKRFTNHHIVVSPESLNVDGTIDVEERRRSIYKTQLYHLESRFKGKFPKSYLEVIKSEGGIPDLDKAYLILGVSDPSGFRSDMTLHIGDKPAKQFLPGLKHASVTKIGSKRLSSQRGVHVPLSENEIKNGFDFDIAMALNGARKLSFTPAGKTTRLEMKSNWPHPGFDGKFLPEKRTITRDGFDATWTVPNLARGIEGIYLEASLPPASSLLGVNFVEPLSFYQVTSRSLKYAIGVFSLVFLAVFVLEFSSKKSLHFIQYVLTGLAMVIFYILLLALAEQVGFLMAYLGAASATTLLIAWYIGDALASKNGSLVVGGVLATTYLILYLTLNEETYALLAGSLIAFIAIAATMFATRKMDWSGTSQPVLQG
jgi:inner membrane protein